MRKISGILALAVVLLSGIWLFRGPPASGQISATGPGLQQFAGTYWLLFEFQDSFLPAIVHLSADGTFVAVDGTDEGLGGQTSLNSAQLGSAERTGPRQVSGRGVFLGFDEAGVPTTATVQTVVSDFDNDFSGGTGIVQGRTYDLAAGENPVDPNQGTLGDPIPFLFFRFQN